MRLREQERSGAGSGTPALAIEAVVRQVDIRRYGDGSDVPERRRYDCMFQGLQDGWSDVYASMSPASHIDVSPTCRREGRQDFECPASGQVVGLQGSTTPSSIWSRWPARADPVDTKGPVRYLQAPAKGLFLSGTDPHKPPRSGARQRPLGSGI